MLFALYALFFLSGAASLMYESIWTRYLALFVGHSAYAQILVLTIFLKGASGLPLLMEPTMTSAPALPEPGPRST